MTRNFIMNRILNLLSRNVLIKRNYKSVKVFSKVTATVSSRWLRNYSDKKKEDPRVTSIMEKVKAKVDEEMAKQKQEIFQFEIKDDGIYLVDLKNGKESASEGKPWKPDAVSTTDLKNLVALFSGNLKPKMAVMLGKLKVGGDTAQAFKLEKLLPEFRGEPGSPLLNIFIL